MDAAIDALLAHELIDAALRTQIGAHPPDTRHPLSRRAHHAWQLARTDHDNGDDDEQDDFTEAESEHASKLARYGVRIHRMPSTSLFHEGTGELPAGGAHVAPPGIADNCTYAVAEERGAERIEAS